MRSAWNTAESSSCSSAAAAAPARVPVFLERENIERAEQFLVEQGIDVREAADAVAKRLATMVGVGERVCPECKAAAQN